MRRRAASVLLACAIVALAIAGCSSTFSVAFVDTNATYDTSKLQKLLADTAAADRVSESTTAEAAELRHEALVQIRSHGAGGSSAADLITRTFPASTKSVPIYAEWATVEGAESLILIEAWADPSGKLGSKRLWVINAQTEEIVYSASAPSR
jgi:hypothetical protein